MKIAYISSHSIIPSRDANSVHIMKMSSAYSTLGHEVTLFVSNYKGDLEPGCTDVFEQYAVRDRFTIWRIPVPSNTWARFFFMALLTPFVAKLKSADLIHARSLTAAWGAARFFRIPVICELHGPPDANPKTLKMFLDLARSKYLKAIVVITEALKNHVINYLPRHIKIIVAPDGIPQSYLKGVDGSKEVREKLLKISVSRKMAMYTGHLYPGRGVELILSIAPQLSSYHFFIIGGTEMDISRCRQLASGINNITFVGYISPASIRSYQCAADVLLMPYADVVTIVRGVDTAKFASPLKMFEYMASGKIIISSKLPVLSEILRDGQNAIMVDYNEPMKWVEALKHLDANPSFGDALAKQALIDVSQYTWENRALTILDFFNSKE